MFYKSISKLSILLLLKQTVGMFEHLNKFRFLSRAQKYYASLLSQRSNIIHNTFWESSLQQNIKWNKSFTHVKSSAVTSWANIWVKERFVLSEGIGLMPELAEQVTKELNAASGWHSKALNKKKKERKKQLNRGLKKLGETYTKRTLVVRHIIRKFQNEKILKRRSLKSSPRKNWGHTEKNKRCNFIFSKAILKTTKACFQNAEGNDTWCKSLHQFKLSEKWWGQFWLKQVTGRFTCPKIPGQEGMRNQAPFTSPSNKLDPMKVLHPFPIMYKTSPGQNLL